VASTTVSPGWTSSDARTSFARTGTWSVALGCKTFGNIFCTPFDLGELAAPCVAIPDFQVVVHARDDDVAAELRVLEQSGRKPDPALLGELGPDRAREEKPVHAAPLFAEGVERGEVLLDEGLPGARRIGRETAVHLAGHDDPVRENMAETGRQREPVLVVDGVFVFAEEHRGAVPLSTTLLHDKPLLPTCPPRKGDLRGRASGRSGQADQVSEGLVGLAAVAVAK